VLLLLLNSAAFAQTGASSGKIADEFGDAVSGASVQAKDAAGKEFKATSTATGEYTIDKLPPGVYEVTVTMLTMKNFVKKDVAVVAAEASRLDVKLVDGGGLGTLGDGDRFTAAFFAALKRPPPPTGPTPRLPDGKPNLSGFWVPPQQGADAPPEARPEQPEPLPWADAIRQERLRSHFRDLPDSRCLPTSIVSWAGQGKFVHTPSMLVILHAEDPPRQIFLDGRNHPKDLNPTWLGHSVGHWEGDTLVVDTVGFNGLAWYGGGGGIPSTELLHVVERYHRTDLGHMEVEVTLEDPPVLRKPWVQKRVLNLDPKEDLEEYICTENEKDVEHLVGK
jgi:hypothetical protein